MDEPGQGSLPFRSVLTGLDPARSSPVRKASTNAIITERLGGSACRP